MYYGMIRIILGLSLYVYCCFIFFIDMGIGNNIFIYVISYFIVYYIDIFGYINRFVIIIIFFLMIYGRFGMFFFLLYFLCGSRY